MNPNKKKISIILPCQNEEKAIGLCIQEIKEVLNQDLKNFDYEIIVSDSSTDKSREIAKSLGAKVIHHGKTGYGRSYLESFAHISGDYLLMLDSDHTYDFKDAPKLIAKLEEGYDLVIGSRLKGKIDKGAMPILHQYLGTPMLNFFLRFFFQIRLSDSQSGFRAMGRDLIGQINLSTSGMEFASEMLVKAKNVGTKISEVPIHYRKRIGKSKLKSFNDGWKHLRFMLLYSPTYLFMIPGIFLFTIGALVSTAFLFPPVNVLGRDFITHPMFISSLSTIVGFQLILLGIFAKTYVVNHLGSSNILITKLNQILNLEKALALGSIIFLGGLILFINIAISWISRDFGEIHNPNYSIYALTLMIVGIQTISSAFFISILGIKSVFNNF